MLQVQTTTQIQVKSYPNNVIIILQETKLLLKESNKYDNKKFHLSHLNVFYYFRHTKAIYTHT